MNLRELGPSRRTLSKAWIVLPAVLLCVVDAGLTLFFQPSPYWLSEFLTADEISPVGEAFLYLHPLAFVGFMLVWAAVIVLGGLVFREPWNRVWGLMIIVGHTAGVFGRLEDFDYLGALPVFFLVALLTVFGWRKGDSLPAWRRPPSLLSDRPQATPSEVQ